MENLELPILNVLNSNLDRSVFFYSAPLFTRASPLSMRV